jgi:hypothetical protein
MATTTPNFGWPVPTSTDLVKDGATAIEGLGDAIDASLLDLKGGTTGQVLSKASATNMDFSWITPASGGGGKVLQVVTATTTTGTTTTATTPQATSVTATITPSATSSRILILVTNEILQTNHQFNRCTTKVFRGTVSGTQINMGLQTQQNVGSGALVAGSSLIGIDSPSTTSATTYVQSIESLTSGEGVTCSGRQNIILMEIGA